MATDPLAAWHHIVATRDARALATLLAEDVVFHSPVVHTPQRGRMITMAYLGAAVEVLGGPKFRYLREFRAADGAVLEFETELDGLVVNGVDMLQWNAAGQVTDFKVMVRPLKAVNIVHQKMGERLQQLAAAAPRG